MSLWKQRELGRGHIVHRKYNIEGDIILKVDYDLNGFLRIEELSDSFFFITFVFNFIFFVFVFETCFRIFV